MEEEEKNAELVGRSVRKYFEGHGYFGGRVVSYDRERKYFRVKYADGDREEVELHELKEILVDGGDSAPAKRPRGRPRKVLSGGNFFSRATSEECEKAADQGHGELIQATNFKDLIAQEVFKVLKRKRQEGNESTRPRGRPRKRIRREEEKTLAMEKEEKTLAMEKEEKTLAMEKEEEAFENKDGEVFEKKEQDDDKPLKPVTHRRKSVSLDRPCPLRHIPLKQREKELQEQVCDKAQAVDTTCQVEETDLNIPLLPPSSVDLNIPSESILHLFSAYTFLRSFSWVIFLSPFSLREFIRCLNMKEANALIDQIHLSLLLLLRQHLEDLAGDGNDSAIRCLKCRDWTLLDAFSWPSFLVAYLLHGNYRLEGKEELLDIGILHGEYYGLEVGSKIDILSFICDRVLDTDEIRSELSKRSNGDSEVDMRTAVEDTQLEPISRRETRRTRRSSPSDNSELVDPPTCVEERPTPDGNTDDCVLCGMDGNLICCDGCPAAYHSRCVGLSRSMLPEGDWYCPECTLQMIAMEETRPRKGVRGFECLGVDTYGRRYVAVVEHLFISKSSSLDSSYVCYGPRQISQALELLDSTGSLSARLKAIIIEHWSIPDDSHKNETFSSQVGDIATKDESCTHKDGIEGEQIIPTRPTHDIGLSKPKFRGTQETYFEACSYVNQYAQGGLAALAASNLAEKSTNKRAAVQRTQIFEQIKAFSRAPVQFYWPSLKKKRMEGPRDRCGWCFVCKNLSKKKGCLLNTAAGKLLAGAAVVSGGLRPIRKGVNYLPSLTAYLLYMEERLNGLFLGCSWESIDQRKCWRRRVECAGHVKQVKAALMEFGSSLRYLALTKDWSMYAEDSPRLIPLGAANGTVLVSSFKRSGGRRRKKVEAAEPIKIFPGGGIWGVQWRRGGKLVRRFMDWETLPTATLKRAARQGGMKKVPGLLYNDNFEVPRRTVRCAWLSRVEASFSVSELAIQVRFLDTLIRWSDLSIPEDVKAMFQDSIIRERATEDDAFKYLVDTSKTEEELLEMKPEVASCPLKFLKALVGEEGICTNRVWLPETHLPLCLVRDFEVKCLSQVRSAIGRKGERQTPRLSKGAKLKAILSKLHALDAKKKIVTCEHCNLDMVASDIVNCRECQGEFHQRCMSRGKSTSKMCQSCSTVKKNSKRSRRLATEVVPQEVAIEAPKIEKPPLLVYFRRRKAVTAVERFRDKVLRKKRSKRPIISSGVRWKFSREVTYRRDKVVFPGQRRAGGVRCAICSQPYDATLLYIGCEHCQEWFHGRAIGIRRSNVGRVEAFKCFKCRKKGGPYCPYTREKG